MALKDHCLFGTCLLIPRELSFQFISPGDSGKRHHPLTLTLTLLTPTDPTNPNPIKHSHNAGKLSDYGV